MPTLIVEDDPALMKALSSKLSAAGFTNLFEAPDGVAALGYLKLNTPKILILDLGLPVVAGKEVLEALYKDKEIKSKPKIYIITNDQDANLDSLGDIPKDNITVIYKWKTELDEIVKLITSESPED